MNFQLPKLNFLYAINFMVKFNVPGHSFCLLNFLILHSFLKVLKLTNFGLTEGFIKMPLFLTLFNFLVDKITKY